MRSELKKNEEPLYKQLEAILRKKIENNEYPPDSPIPSESKFCAEYRVSRRTIRRAILELIHKKYLVSRAGLGTFVLSENARTEGGRFRSKRTGSIAFIYEHEAFYDNPTILEYLKGVKEKLKNTNYNLLFPFSKNDLSNSVFSLCKKIVNEEKAEAYLLISVAPEIQKWFAEQNVPVVVSGDLADGVDLPNFSNEQSGINRESVRYLVGLGHRRIAYVSYLSNVVGIMHRDEGYYAALRENRIKIKKEYVVKTKQIEWKVREAVRKLVKVNPSPTAIIFHNDYMANFGLMELRDLNLKVPEDISIIAGDGSILSEFSVPKLTSFVGNYKKMGENAVGILLDVLKKGTFGKEHKKKIDESRMVIRESCREYTGNDFGHT